jgi:hypothetical protein
MDQTTEIKFLHHILFKDMSYFMFLSLIILEKFAFLEEETLF